MQPLPGFGHGVPLKDEFLLGASPPPGAAHWLIGTCWVQKGGRSCLSVARFSGGMRAALLTFPTTQKQNNRDVP